MYDFNCNLAVWGQVQEMTEIQALRSIESISEMYYDKTKDKWWLKLAIYAEKRLNERSREA